jgi:predicted AAA+ superfamily ATPase
LHEAIHQKLVDYFKLFLVLGGMPAVVAEYANNKDMLVCQQILDDLVNSFQTDFAKYKERVPASRIREVFEAVVHQSGGRFVYAKAAVETNFYQIKEALDLLVMAGLVIPVTSTAANGLPLGAEVNPKKCKMLLFDTGIFQRILGLKIADILFSDDFNTINKGAIAEQYVGLEILKSASCYSPDNLYFWAREALNSNAEVDYLLQIDQQIVPVEVKAGTKGSMQSLFLFLKEKNISTGIRTSLENFGVYESIEVYPLYAISNLRNHSF